MKPKIHNSKISKQEYIRQIKRRGTKHAFSCLESHKTALIVVDMIPFFVEQNKYCLGIIPNINKLANEVRNQGGKVIFAVPSGNYHNKALQKELYGAEIAELYRNAALNKKGKAAVYKLLTLKQEDLIIEKSGKSCFVFENCNASLKDILQQSGMENIIITGTVTNICCEQAARDGYEHGFRVVMVSDGNAAKNNRDHNQTLKNIYRSFGDVLTTQELIKILV